MRIFIDIETVPDQTPGALEAIRATIKPPGQYSKPESIAKWLEENAPSEADKLWRKTALSGTSGEIVCIGFAVGDHGAVETLHRSPGESEQDLLWFFWDTLTARMEERHGHPAAVEWCGHNVAFDLRFLRQRSAVRRVTPTLLIDPSKRHGGGHLFCTMQEWAGVREFIGLDALCRALGVESPKAEGMDGGKVYDAWIEGRAEEIAAYCKRDVEAARQCHRLLTFAEAA